MKAACVCLTLVVIGASGIPSQQAPTVKPNFTGVWKNVRSSADISGGLLSVRVFEDGSAVKLAISGHCVPQPCEWEPVTFWQLPDVTRSAADRGFGSWPDGRHVTLRLEGTELIVELYRTVAKQNERGPLSYFAVQRFARGVP